MKHSLQKNVFFSFPHTVEERTFFLWQDAVFCQRKSPCAFSGIGKKQGLVNCALHDIDCRAYSTFFQELS